MSRRSRKGYWPIFLLLMAVGYFVRGGATSTSTRPAGSSPTSRGTERPEQQPARTPTRLARPVENSSPEVTAPVTRNRGQHLSLRVVGVHDGDTLTGLDDSKTQFKVRLDAIDAPELGQPFGQASKRALSEKVFGKDVVVIPKTRDKYGRTVGHVMVDGRDVNLEMLEEGMAWHYEKYDHNKRLRAAEQAARAAQRGLWQDLTSVPPWDWRKSQKQRREP
jgi:endonuclease YncB( thermonuclease family)